MSTLVMEEMSVVEVASVAAMVVVDMVAVRMAIMDLVMMEASMGCSTPGLPVHHQLPESTQKDVH